MIEPSSIDLVLYHGNCSDGFGAAYSAWKLLGNRAEYIPCFHGADLPDVKGKRVAMLDFTFPNAQTKQLIEEAESFIIIDHHKSAMVELHDINCTIFDMNKSGAMLAWEFFHPGKEAPKFIQYIQDRDLWSWELPYSKEFSAAFDMVPWDFHEFEKFEDDSVFDDAVKRGSYILAYSKTVIKKICDKAVKRQYNDFDVMVVNSSHWMSEIGSSLAKDCDFAMIWFYDHDAREYSISLRAFHETMDVSEIAKQFNGGGHRKAAGFRLPITTHPDSIFETPEEEMEDHFDDEITDEHMAGFGAD
jgi:oligoribonuclease NrnB/cAMP/cGMP phosphodiesterase (DHH superfamily)